MPKAPYDPAAAHQYYEEHKNLKGRKKGSPTPHVQRHVANAKQVRTAQQKVTEIQGKLKRLRDLLHEKQRNAHKPKPTGKPTQADKTKDRKNSEHYRNTHKQQIKNLSKGGGHKSAAKGKTAADMGVDELKGAIRETVTQLKHAIANARSLKGG